MNPLESFKTWAHDAATWIHLKPHNELDPQATEALIQSATGIAPSDAQAAHLVELAGNKIGGFPGQDAKTVFDGAPRSVDDLAKNIGDAVKQGLNNLLLNWKDKHFPEKLDAALDKQAGVITKMRKVEAGLDQQLSGVQAAKDGLQKAADGLQTKIDAAQAAGKTDLVTSYTVQKNGIEGDMKSLDSEILIVNQTKSGFDDQLSQLETKQQTDAAKAIALKAKWNVNRELKDMPADVQDSYNSFIDLGQQTDTIDRQMNERAQATQAAIQEALKHGVGT